MNDLNYVIVRKDLIYEGITTMGFWDSMDYIFFLVRMDLIYEGITTYVTVVI